MLFNQILLSAFLLLCQAENSATKAITLRPNTVFTRRHGLNERLRRSTSVDFDSTLVVREARPQQSGNSITAPVSSTGTTGNVTAACIEVVSGMDNVTNPAGIVACYAIPYLNTTTGIFTAQMNLYSTAQPSGPFASIPQKDILFTIAYSSASISSYTKKMRRDAGLEQREVTPAHTPTEVQAATFVGALDKSLQLDKLNSTELMSLLIPTIVLEARTPQTSQLVTTNLAASDIVLFPTGIFSTESQSSIAAADSPALAAEAATKAAAFVLPGVRLGIFPTGLIVTGSWSVLFLAAFGLGTLGRIKHRHEYRHRIANPRRRRPRAVN